MNIAIPFTQYIVSGYETKGTRHTEWQHNLKRKNKQASDMAGMEKFKTKAILFWRTFNDLTGIQKDCSYPLTVFLGFIDQ